jgi:UDP-N-acetylglucosamine--N-acetylmuramyl-(pentapeptide) pyrophosphoryl-undecaprenol N-acetylglucosamine transferase
LIEAEVTPERLLQVLRDLLADDQRRAEMGQRARALANPNAVREIAGIAVGLAR